MKIYSAQCGPVKTTAKAASSVCTYPEDPLEAGEVPDFDPDATTDCWFAMAADPSPPTVDARASTFYNDDEVEDGLAFGFPFQAGCAKWICCALAERGVSLEQLVAYLGETLADQDGLKKWMGDLEECCPDGASIQEIHDVDYTDTTLRLFGWHAYSFARPDTIWWQKDYGINPHFPDLRPSWNEVAAKTILGDDGDFDMVRGTRIRDAVRGYDERDVDWKRAYFCYESRNARRITRNAKIAGQIPWWGYYGGAHNYVLQGSTGFSLGDLNASAGIDVTTLGLPARRPPPATASPSPSPCCFHPCPNKFFANNSLPLILYASRGAALP
ncbi:hypothetical protein DFJ73DRAFT_797229 [Zopfochytrium polystomum]|nr:hypothetical protein DFJ73DRAFT_797229 [Zopfochytrium polystomum]